MENSFLVIAAYDGLAHVQLKPEFEITLESMRSMWESVLPFCENHSCRRILIEGEKPTRTMRKLDAYEHGRLVADVVPTGIRVGFCLYDYKPDEMSNIFTTIANERANTVRFFQQLDVALSWLRA